VVNGSGTVYAIYACGGSVSIVGVYSVRSILFVCGGSTDEREIADTRNLPSLRD